MSAEFTVPAELDLSGDGYIAIAGRPPVEVPESAKYRRAATHGSGPHTYRSSDEAVALVDAQGTVTAVGVGRCVITAHDSTGTAAQYELAVRGLRTVYLVSPAASLSGAHAACAAVGLTLPTLADFKGLWASYYPSSGPVATYAAWLPYPFWTAGALGGGTACAYDLDGYDRCANAFGRNASDSYQVLGMSST
ncbi:Ig-like domain-containing protein [Streptomyces sp. NPDC056367]|uniref:Ig-like domain-containing protein n=1 Tax=Streptomyces sp. NPDC056367 TaxID=3345797 RepID=UPI0035D66336